MKEFSNTIKKAKQIIEKYNAEQLYRKEQVTGIIFNLKNNFDWKDKSEVDSNVNLKAEINNMSELPTDELIKLANGNH
jgi:hypothetical protein